MATQKQVPSTGSTSPVLVIAMPLPQLTALRRPLGAQKHLVVPREHNTSRHASISIGTA